MVGVVRHRADTRHLLQLRPGQFGAQRQPVTRVQEPPVPGVGTASPLVGQQGLPHTLLPAQHNASLTALEVFPDARPAGVVRRGLLQHRQPRVDGRALRVLGLTERVTRMR